MLLNLTKVAFRKECAIYHEWRTKIIQNLFDLFIHGLHSFELLKNVDEGFYDELNKIINKIVPLCTSESMHNSASYTECIGHLYMWFVLWVDQPEISNLEAIIHESSHNKLNVLFVNYPGI